jgi:outer membrane murein-binding lipoprotein Lpp
LELFRLLDALLMPENPFEDGMMKAYHLTIAAAAAGLLLAAGSASATPLAPKSAAAMGVDPLNAAVEPVHYRRHRGARHHYYYPRYRAPAVTFGFAPVVTPYYAYPTAILTARIIRGTRTPTHTVMDRRSASASTSARRRRQE